jgi:predicted HTH transcriptional regulator
MGCLDRAFEGAETILVSVLRKARSGMPTPGQHSTLLTASVSPSTAYLAGSKGKLTSSNYAALAERSQDTAARDIEDLSRQGILARDAAGRSEHQLQSYRHYTRCIE